MLWSRHLRSAALASLMVSLGGVLGACSFTPVYSGALASQPLLNLAYAKPTSRLEQIVYQELALRLGSSQSETVPLASVSISTSAADIMSATNTNPAQPVKVTLTAALTITPRDEKGGPATTIRRVATATYSRNGQVLADNAAAEEANERAARSAAESLRLAILASLSRR